MYEFAHDEELSAGCNPIVFDLRLGPAPPIAAGAGLVEVLLRQQFRCSCNHDHHPEWEAGSNHPLEKWGLQLRWVVAREAM